MVFITVEVNKRLNWELAARLEEISSAHEQDPGNFIPVKSNFFLASRATKRLS